MKKSPLRRKTALGRKNTATGQKSGKKKHTKADLNREWGIPANYSLRWTGIRGVVWYWMSRYVRMRDAKKYGKCISCNFRSDAWTDYDAGHYVAVSRSLGLSLELVGVNGQCKKCNNPRWTPDASIPYAVELDKRYGEGTAKKLYERSRGINKLPSELELIAMAKDYKKLAEEM